MEGGRSSLEGRENRQLLESQGSTRECVSVRVSGVPGTSPRLPRIHQGIQMEPMAGRSWLEGHEEARPAQVKG